MSSIDLSQLPAPDVIEVLDYETLLAERKATLIALYPIDQQPIMAATLALESEPIVRILQENAYREMVLRARINDASRAVMLAFARDADLDQLAANCDVQRLVITPADPDAVPPVDAIYESDADLRIRVQDAWEALSVAGPRAAYIAHARAADGRVADASAISPAPAEVVVTVLAREGDGSASQDLLTIVATALNDESVRPVADRLTVQSPAITNYTVTAALYIYPGPAAGPIIAAATARLGAHVQAQRRLGRDIRRTALIAALHVEGVQRVELTEPAADVVLGETAAAHCTGSLITIGGTDE